MTSKKRFNKLIDDLRIIAAILVVAIHTAPLFEYNEFISYFITNIIGRLAVPYFFVLSGYFLFKKFKHQNDEERMETFVKTEKNLLIMYGLTLIIYIPVWLYLHGLDFGKFVVDLLWNGMHYHLWYFPALIVGVGIVYFLYNRLNTRKTFILLALLYLFGSIFNVYGTVLPESFVTGVMGVIGNPRNGIFFAPLFIFIGRILAEHQLRFKDGVIYLMVALFIAEPVILYFAKLSDPLNAMFLTLPLAIYLLMTKVLNTKSSTHSSVFYHNVSLYLYVIHPVVILGNRLIIGKVLDMELTNTLNFVLTLLISLVVSYGYQFVKDQYEKNK